MADEPIDPPPAGEGDGLGRAVGIEYLDSSAEVARARVAVSDVIRQPYGIVHGGAFAVIAESLCSRATLLVVAADGMICMGQSNQASFLRPITTGTIHAVARSRHRGRSTWIWDTEISDDEGQVCALVRMTIAVRPRPEGR